MPRTVHELFAHEQRIQGRPCELLWAHEVHIENAEMAIVVFKPEPYDPDTTHPGILHEIKYAVSTDEGIVGGTVKLWWEKEHPVVRRKRGN